VSNKEQLWVDYRSPFEPVRTAVLRRLPDQSAAHGAWPSQGTRAAGWMRLLKSRQMVGSSSMASNP